MNKLYFLILFAFYGQPKTNTDFNVKLELQVNETKKSDDPLDLSLKISFCNKTDKKLFLPFFISPELRIKILKHDPVKMKYENVTKHFYTLQLKESWKNENMKSTNSKEEIDENKFVDSLAIVLSNRIYEEGKCLPGSVNHFKNIIEIDLLSVFYIGPHQCVDKIVSLNSLRLDGSTSYKIFLQDSVERKHSANKDREMINDVMPSNLRGYEQWSGIILSDTLYLANKR